ncbi:MAG: signal peptidase I [Bacteroidia bacterium]|nr:signal peptidase I [Bacteroidia bacterium]MCX7763869.1 signal peptidase I [Bacteroidia bacterium]MDW8057696.1 signal peptidase I [Bacteroidia bacterium]
MSSAPKAKRRRWWRELLIALGIILFLRTFVVEAFLIPTSSMERTLLAWDLVFVSKLHYGPRLPMVPLAIPFIHNRIPFTGIPSYLDWIVLPYIRLPGFKPIQRGDIIVFNYPADDIMPNSPELGPVYIPSVKENYVKRCVGIPGDTIEIRAGNLYVNGKPAYHPRYVQERYRVVTKGAPLTYRVLKPYGFRPAGSSNLNWIAVDEKTYLLDMPRYLAEEFQKKFSEYLSVFTRDLDTAGHFLPQVYPHDSTYRWNLDYWGPFYLPKKGDRIPLTPQNLLLYRRLIEAYEDHTISVSGGQVYIDGQPQTEYTFSQNYYFAMGDNRYNSLDGRFWGPVPEDHIVGKPIFVLLSIENWIPRWDRFLRAVQ